MTLIFIIQNNNDECIASPCNSPNSIESSPAIIARMALPCTRHDTHGVSHRAD